MGYLIAPTAEYHFNSIKVRLELSLDMLRAAAEDDFNSIKVRLEQEGGQLVAVGHYEFQFHKGAIRTPSPPCRGASAYISIP